MVIQGEEEGGGKGEEGTISAKSLDNVGLLNRKSKSKSGKEEVEDEANGNPPTKVEEKVEKILLLRKSRTNFLVQEMFLNFNFN